SRRVGEQICVAVVDVKSGKVMHELCPEIRPEDGWQHIVFSRVLPNGKTVLTNRFRKDPHSLVEIWDLAEGTRLRSFPIESCGEYQEPTTAPTGKTLGVGGANTPELRFYDIATGQKQIPPPIAAFTDADVKRIAALPVAEQIEEVRQELKKRNP